jgi:hypothetical protein
MKNEIRDTTTSSIEIRRIISENYEQLCNNNLDGLGEMDKFQETQSLLNLNHE